MYSGGDGDGDNDGDGDGDGGGGGGGSDGTDARGAALAESSWFQRHLASMTGVWLSLDELLRLRGSFARVRAAHDMAWAAVERAEAAGALESGSEGLAGADDHGPGVVRYTGLPPRLPPAAARARNAVRRLLAADCGGGGGDDDGGDGDGDDDGGDS